MLSQKSRAPFGSIWNNGSYGMQKESMIWTREEASVKWLRVQLDAELSRLGAGFQSGEEAATVATDFPWFSDLCCVHPRTCSDMCWTCLLYLLYTAEVVWMKSCCSIYIPSLNSEDRHWTPKTNQASKARNHRFVQQSPGLHSYAIQAARATTRGRGLREVFWITILSVVHEWDPVNVTDPYGLHLHFCHSKSNNVPFFPVNLGGIGT